MDYGTPLGLCKESKLSMFTREYTKATTSHDCNSGNSLIMMKGKL